ncbi:unnamed protein product [Paramecium primaurelia]|uniref:Uncharacterized protein n=1 Tax=Paramecium primaurelia TaxID=5886 RepID=A0A8S1L5H4_PARPR|nr:unnamed protein product [Paramecium primaurelia]
MQDQELLVVKNMLGYNDYYKNLDVLKYNCHCGSILLISNLNQLKQMFWQIIMVEMKTQQ